MKIDLNEDQKKAYGKMALGKSVLITGGAGVGKSSLIKYYVDSYKRSKRIAVTSTTGVSALLIGGTTLHSYLGIGLGTNSIDAIITKVKKKRYLRERWTKMDVLVIDELSMLSPILFDKIEAIARELRRSDLPFGGVQLILSADFCQLKCIDCDKFCFDADSWESCVEEVMALDTIIRQRDKDFQHCLNEIRVGNITDEVRATLDSRIGARLENDLNIQPTKLYPLNMCVDAINSQELTKLSERNGSIYEYPLEFITYSSVSAIDIEKYKKFCPASLSLQLTEGCQVMLIHNLDIQRGLINGSRGVVTKFADDLPVVKFLNGEERLIDFHIWEIEEDDKKIASIEQVPLKLGYAYSIHKAQGCTLDYVIIDLEDIFDYGMAYVALSRVKDLEGLSISRINWDRVQAHPHAVSFYKNN